MIEKLHQLYPSLYGKEYNEKELDNRFLSLVEKHNKLFGNSTPMLFSASGRTEIAGNHTDHNLGLVIGASINLDTIAAVTKRDDSIVTFISEGFPLITVDISDTEVKESEKNTTNSLIRGIANGFIKRGVSVGGWNANVSSTVLIGSGLSSSASVEVLIGEIFNSLFNEDKFSPIEIAKIGQYAENIYFGKPSGLLDQVSCANGGAVLIDFKDKEEPVIESLKLDLASFDLAMVITAVGDCHAFLTDEYSAIPNEMKEVAHFFGKESLREVDYNLFLESIKELREKLKNDRAILRAYHYFSENERVTFMKEELENEDIDTFLYNVNESGISSFCFLQNVYPSINTKEQGLSVALFLSQQILMGEGASRVHGGGFAGTIQAYVPRRLLERYISKMENVFGKGCSTVISIRNKSVCRLI